jgi:hypothetical protein
VSPAFSDGNAIATQAVNGQRVETRETCVQAKAGNAPIAAKPPPIIDTFPVSFDGEIAIE